ncbi:MAG: TIGR03032 family protein [Pseudomonadota bacterium]
MSGPKNIKASKVRPTSERGLEKRALQGGEQGGDKPLPEERRKLGITCSKGMVLWLLRNRCSLAFTSYRTGQLFLVGVTPKGALSFHQRDFKMAMGLWTDAASQSLYLATHYQIWRLENILRPGELANEHHDRCYHPRQSLLTGDLQVHDVGVEKDGRIVFVNTAYSCLAVPDPVHSFRPLWKPPFISELTSDDRCHLNGLAMEAGHPRYVTAVSRSDVARGWRDERSEGGLILDVTTNTVVTESLSMPHSPRLHKGRLYVLDSGRGKLCHVDRTTGMIEPIAFCPGFLRGLAFHNDHAIVGLSLPGTRSFAGLELDRTLKKKRTDPWCGVQIVDLKSGEVAEWIRLAGDADELFDVAVLPNVRCPMALDFVSRDIEGTHSFPAEYAGMKTLAAADALAASAAE